MKCVSFFAGVGGIDLGFEQAGFESIYLNDNDSNAIKTLKSNFSCKIDSRSIREIEPEELPDFDILLAGFPCQAFSIAGHGQGFNDEKGRGNLFFELQRIFSLKKPEVIFLENVKNLVSHDKGNTFKVILSILKKEGYYVKYKVLNSSEYGNIPQNRERIYIVCFRTKEYYDSFEFPKPIKLTNPISSCLEDENTIQDKYFYTQKTPFFEKLVEEIKDAKTLYQWRRKYVRSNKSNLCPTLTANMGTGGHNVPLLNVQGKPNTIRKLTPRECFNFQGFPQNFILPNIANGQLYKQAGNSVVVPVIFRIAKQIKKAINQGNQKINSTPQLNLL